jgi:hypothetical protein
MSFWFVLGRKMSGYGVFWAFLKCAMKAVACKISSVTWQLVTCVESIPKRGSLGSLRRISYCFLGCRKAFEIWSITIGPGQCASWLADDIVKTVTSACSRGMQALGKRRQSRSSVYFDRSGLKKQPHPILLRTCKHIRDVERNLIIRKGTGVVSDACVQSCLI